MPKLIYIKASPRKERSHSSRVAKQFIDAYQAIHSEDTIEELDLWHIDLPPFDGDTIDAKYAIMHQKLHTHEQKDAWNQVTTMFQQFASADKYLFSVPMWNFGIPYRLKHYIDIITQPGLAFNVTPEEGYVGLVTDKPAVLVYASGGAYGPGSGAEANDLQSVYLKLWLQFIGFKDIKEINVYGTLNDPTKVKEVEEACIKQANEIAKTF